MNIDRFSRSRHLASSIRQLRPLVPLQRVAANVRGKHSESLVSFLLSLAPKARTARAFRRTRSESLVPFLRSLVPKAKEARGFRGTRSESLVPLLTSLAPIARTARVFGTRAASRSAGLVGPRLLLGVLAGGIALGGALWIARTLRTRRAAVRAGGDFRIVRCPLHGIAYDAELEECTECAKTLQGDGRGTSMPAARDLW
jgi:hypothetical protein